MFLLELIQKVKHVNLARTGTEPEWLYNCSTYILRESLRALSME